MFKFIKNFMADDLLNCIHLAENISLAKKIYHCPKPFSLSCIWTFSESKIESLQYLSDRAHS